MAIDLDGCSFRVLGPVQVFAAGEPVTFVRRQHLDLLAFLLLHTERVVTADQIVDAMWGPAVPRTASMQIKNMLSALRAVLDDGCRTLAVVDRQRAGYRLRIVAGQLDLSAFKTLVASARTAAAPDAKVLLLRQALSLWQGTRALAGVRAAFVDTARAHLEEERSAALEALFEAELACGNHAGIVADLTEAVADNPGRERLVGQLMVALYRGDRPTDALAVFRRARHTLVEEYGLDPGPVLRDLERRILLGDAALHLPGDAGGGTDGRAETARTPDAAVGASGAGAEPGAAVPCSALPMPRQLPMDVRGFAGRGAELAELNALVSGTGEKPATVVITALMGTAGVGKTALAVHWAHQVIDRFPDGQLYVNLRGFGPGGPAMSPVEAVRGFLDAFQVPPERIPAGLDAQTALYRSIVAGRRVLVVLDNAASAEQVRPLLPGSPGCLVVVTSRNQLTGLVAVEGACPLTLDVLTDVEARELLVGRLGADRVAAAAGAVEEIAGQCARLPLALAMVAARAATHPAFPLGTLAAELSHARGLAALSSADRTADVRSVFSWSYRRLGPPAARLFSLLSLHPGPAIAAPTAAALAGVQSGQVRPLLAELAGAHLVTELAPGRFAFHDLLRTYAGEMVRSAVTTEQRRAAQRRMFDHYLQTANAAALLLYPYRHRIDLVSSAPGAEGEHLTDRGHALSWLSTEHRALVAAVDHAAAAGFDVHAWQLAFTLASFLDRHGHWQDWLHTQHAALAAAERSADLTGQAHANGGLGLAHVRMGHHRQAEVHLDRALGLLRQLDDGVGEAYVQLRLSAVCEGRGDHAQALHHAQRALDLYRSAGHRAGQAQALNSIGWYHAHLGRHPDAVRRCEQAVALHRELGDREGSAHAMDSLGFAHQQVGDYDRAAAYFTQAADILHETGDRYYEATALIHLGDARRAAGDIESAHAAWRRSRDILSELGHPDAATLDAKLSGTG
jgi:DNA-binding SARP family transcriptional activator/tetratricopeptide (TPR) repeat protein